MNATLPSLKALGPDQRFALRNRSSEGARPDSGIFNAGKIGEARLDLIPALDECDPGIEPVEYNLIVAPARTARTMGVKGLIHRTEQDVETEEMAQQMGRIIAMSPFAFNYETWSDESKKPQVGDIVWFARYAGGLIEAAFDGNTYRIIKDKDVAGIIRERPTITLSE